MTAERTLEGPAPRRLGLPALQVPTALALARRFHAPTALALQHVPGAPQLVLLEVVAARGTRNEALYVVAAHTGLRQGELLGLKWTDVDLASRRLSVRRALKVTDHGLDFGPPKNNARRRSVPLSKTAVAVLRAHSQRKPWLCSRSCYAISRCARRIASWRASTSSVLHSRGPGL